MDKKEIYTKPLLREKLRKEILDSSKGGAKGKWSARKAQLLASEYKKRGGGYKTTKAAAMKDKKSPQSKLASWTKEKWDYITNKDNQKPKSQRGRYLPKKVREKLSPGQKTTQNAVKRKAGGVGSRAQYSERVKKLVRKITRRKK